MAEGGTEQDASLHHVFITVKGLSGRSTTEVLIVNDSQSQF
jgi:hypothetical protein